MGGHTCFCSLSSGSRLDRFPRVTRPGTPRSDSSQSPSPAAGRTASTCTVRAHTDSARPMLLSHAVAPRGHAPASSGSGAGYRLDRPHLPQLVALDDLCAADAHHRARQHPRQRPRAAQPLRQQRLRVHQVVRLLACHEHLLHAPGEKRGYETDV